MTPTTSHEEREGHGLPTKIAHKRTTAANHGTQCPPKGKLWGYQKDNKLSFETRRIAPAGRLRLL